MEFMASIFTASPRKHRAKSPVEPSFEIQSKATKSSGKSQGDRVRDAKRRMTSAVEKLATATVNTEPPKRAASEPRGDNVEIEQAEENYQPKTTPKAPKPPKAVRTPLSKGRARKSDMAIGHSTGPPGNTSEEDGEHTFTRFADYRWDGDAIEIEVEWKTGSSTWEPEANLHTDAPRELVSFWKSKGGRPTNPRDADLFEVHAIKKHSQDRKKLLVEWVGFGPRDSTWEPRTAIEKSAGDIVTEYWRSVETKAGSKKRRTQKSQKRHKKR